MVSPLLVKVSPPIELAELMVDELMVEVLGHGGGFANSTK
jgi:hypothetical protein